MKDMFLCAALLAALCSLFALNAKTADDCKKTVCAKIDTVCDAIASGDGGMIEKTGTAAQKEWERKFKAMRYLYHHNVTDSIDEAVFKAQHYIGEKNYEKALLKLSEAKYLIKNLDNQEKITLDNIF